MTTATISRHPDWIDPEGDLDGVDSNDLMIVGYTSRALKAAGNKPSVVAEFREQAFSGDYDHLLAVCMTYIGMTDPDPKETR